MTLDLAPETPVEIIEQLRRELAHVSEQCQTAHAMAMSWRSRALTAEEQVRRLEQRLRRRGATETTPEPTTDESEHAALSLPAVW